MLINQVTVEVHEKRNHPYEYGHSDCSMRVVADLDPGDDFQETVLRLRTEAREHVREELDGWIAAIEDERRIDGLIGSLRQRTMDVANNYQALRQAKQALREIRELPEEMRPAWKNSLRSALARRRERIAERERRQEEMSVAHDGRFADTEIQF